MMLGEQTDTDGENGQPESCDCTPIHRFAFVFEPPTSLLMEFYWDIGN